MNITERAARVLQQIKKRRAVIAKATPGPWRPEREPEMTTTCKRCGKTTDMPFHTCAGVFPTDTNAEGPAL